MKYGITAATSHYGSAALRDLLEFGVDPTDVVAFARGTDKLADVASQGVEVRELDYTGDLTGKFDGIDRLLFIPTADHGGRVEMNRAVIEAAQASGVQDLIYVSFVNATEFPDSPLTPDHAATEQLLDASTMNTLAVRSGFYFQNVLGGADGYVGLGALPNLSGDTKIAAADRDDMAEAAARLLTADQVPSGILTFTGERITYADMAQALSDATCRPVQAALVTPEQYEDGLKQAGMPAEAAAGYTAVELATKAGAHDADSDDLARVLGRTPTTFADAAKAWAAHR